MLWVVRATQNPWVGMFEYVKMVSKLDHFGVPENVVKAEMWTFHVLAMLMAFITLD